MCTVPMPTDVYPVAVDKYINIKINLFIYSTVYCIQKWFYMTTQNIKTYFSVS